MAVKAGDLELDLIDSLTESVAGRLSTEPEAAYRQFVRQYYHWVPAKDLADQYGPVVAERAKQARETAKDAYDEYAPVVADRVKEGAQQARAPAGEPGPEVHQAWVPLPDCGDVHDVHLAGVDPGVALARVFVDPDQGAG